MKIAIFVNDAILLPEGEVLTLLAVAGTGAAEEPPL
jgi:hypothetical protein